MGDSRDTDIFGLT